MALTVPSTDEFLTFWGNEAEDVDEDRAESLLELSANLLWLATALDDDPVDPRLAMLVRFAICDMAIFLYVTRESIDEQYSPFVSERLGSYSYSKTYTKTAAAVASRADTGVLFFDRVVQYFSEDAMFSGSGLVSSENVFAPGYVPLAYDAFAGFRGLDPQRMPLTRQGWYTFIGNADQDSRYS